MYLVNVYYIVINDSHAYMYVKINGVCIFTLQLCFRSALDV